MCKKVHLIHQIFARNDKYLFLCSANLSVKNLDKHIENLQSFGQTVVVAFNRYANDTDEELDFVRQHCEEMGVGFAINNAFMEGGDGAIELANLVVNTIENNPSQPLTFTYDETDSVEEKVTKIACELYGAKQVLFGPAARKKIIRR